MPATTPKKDKFSPDEYVKTVLDIAQGMISEGEKLGIDVEISWSLPNSLRRDDAGNIVIDTDEAMKNMGQLNIKAARKVSIS